MIKIVFLWTSCIGTSLHLMQNRPSAIVVLSWPELLSALYDIIVRTVKIDWWQTKEYKLLTAFSNTYLHFWIGLAYIAPETKRNRESPTVRSTWCAFGYGLTTPVALTHRAHNNIWPHCGIYMSAMKSQQKEVLNNSHTRKNDFNWPTAINFHSHNTLIVMKNLAPTAVSGCAK